MGDASLSIPVFGTGTPLESLHRLKLDGPGLANAAVDVVTEGIPEAVDNVKSAFNNFFANTSIAFRF